MNHREKPLIARNHSAASRANLDSRNFEMAAVARQQGYAGRTILNTVVTGLSLIQWLVI